MEYIFPMTRGHLEDADINIFLMRPHKLTLSSSYHMEDGYKETFPRVYFENHKKMYLHNLVLVEQIPQLLKISCESLPVFYHKNILPIVT